MRRMVEKEGREEKRRGEEESDMISGFGVRNASVPENHARMYHHRLLVDQSARILHF
jgi:hypothetical protein